MLLYAKKRMHVCAVGKHTYIPTYLHPSMHARMHACMHACIHTYSKIATRQTSSVRAFTTLYIGARSGKISPSWLR